MYCLFWSDYSCGLNHFYTYTDWFVEQSLTAQHCDDRIETCERAPLRRKFFQKLQGKQFAWREAIEDSTHREYTTGTNLMIHYIHSDQFNCRSITFCLAGRESDGLCQNTSNAAGIFMHHDSGTLRLAYLIFFSFSTGHLGPCFD